VLSLNRICVPIPAVLAGIFLLGCGACSNCASEKLQAGTDAGKDQDSGTASAIDKPDQLEAVIIGEGHEIHPTLGEPTHRPEKLTAVPTELDLQNRFFPAVIVSSFPPSTPMGSLCTGVRVAPRLVLTAGNCVCDGRKQPALEEGSRR
jgi:hypothetical protein